MNITEKTGKLVTIKSVTDENDLMIINKFLTHSANIIFNIGIGTLAYSALSFLSLIHI